MVSIINTENSKNNENLKNNKIKINEIDYDDECTICFESLKKKDVAILNCKHKFHYECIGKWMTSILKNNFENEEQICPVCEKGIEIENIICREKHIPIKQNEIKYLNNNILNRRKKKCIIS